MEYFTYGIKSYAVKEDFAKLFSIVWMNDIVIKLETRIFEKY